MNIWHTVIGSDAFLVFLGTAAVRSILLALIAGLVLRLLRIKAPSARLLLWATVLYGALAIPFLRLALPPLSMPVLSVFHTKTNKSPTKIAAASARGQSQQNLIEHDLPNQKLSGDESVEPSLLALEKSSNSKKVWPTLSLPGVAFLLYFTIALGLLIRFATGLAFTHRLAKTAQAIRDPLLKSKVTDRAKAISIARVCESKAVSVPVTVGAIRSTILLPPFWREWDGEKLDAVLAHEFSHVTRHDSLTQCAALLHRAIFWFSPLAWWLNRHIADLAEQASDEAALSAGADRNSYARTLLEFLETLNATPQRVWWQGVFMAKPSLAERRLERILMWRGAISMHLKRTAVTAMIALAVPVICLTAAVRPTAAFSPASQEPAPPAAAATVPPDSGVSGAGPTDGVPAPAAPVGGIAAVPVSAPGASPVQSKDSGSTHGHHYRYSYGSDDEQRFVIVTGNSNSFTMSGSSEDARHAEKLRKQISGDFIWFQRDEKSYIIRDQATIDHARKLWAPQEELGKKQEELGKQQEALGKQQSELGAKMEKVRVKVPDMTAKLDKLRDELKSLSSGATQEQIGKLQSEIGELQSQLGEVQSYAGEEQGKLGEQMGALGEQQGKLGEQQGELGRQQGELAERATKEMKQLLDEAIKNGKAQPEPQMNEPGSL